jgi:hypothetical protein
MPAYAKVLTAFAPFLQLLTGATLLNLSPFFKKRSTIFRKKRRPLLSW